jgi:hypothetical protein
MSFSDGAALCAGAVAGYGIAQMHDYYTDNAIAAGALRNSDRAPSRSRSFIRRLVISRRGSGFSLIS